jgi:D-sedoheptulose 7-phosphate isomerase
VRALQYAKQVGSKVIGVVGRDGGYTARVGNAVCIIPTVNPAAVTPHSEAAEQQTSQPNVVVPGLREATEWILKTTDKTRGKG